MLLDTMVGQELGNSPKDLASISEVPGDLSGESH
jgi:hypothetical protein